VNTPTVLMLVALFVVSGLGCWFGSPPDTRRAVVRDVRRERAIRRWQRETRQSARTLNRSDR
jgi:hypothetical protein